MVQTLRFHASVNAARFAGWLIGVFRLGSGSTWPGHLALRIDPHVVRHMCARHALHVIIVAGTNGKSTTSSMIRTILEKKTDERVIYNEEGANLLSGIASVLISRLSHNTHKSRTWCVFESDENALGSIMDETSPNVAVILNLFRDQLDRYGEVNTIADQWTAWFTKHKHTHFVLNADDPLINSLLGDGATNATYFGVSKDRMKKSSLGHDVDSINCPRCRTALTYHRVAYSHIGDYTCRACGYSRHNVNDFPKIATGAYPLMGLYNVYNTHAALVATAVAIDVDQNEALSILKTDFRPMFGRQEMVRYMGRSLTILLSKNPAGFNQSIDAISQLARHKKVAVLLCLNDHIPDGRDVSWIWDVDFEAISEKTVSHIACCGDRAYDMALRIAYTKDASPSVSRTGTYMLGEHPVHLSIARGVDAYTQMAPQDAELFVLATYSAMLEVRKHVVGHNFAAQP